ncbi:hypothetical protein AB0M20_12880 [Actinoplanes sp. NPDC051633]|uniref:hypothetical protein n=1 Tax=Actinoplanes sp. NPDC051633 TaxID=3155670 RepID=UPI003441FE3B
MPPESAEIESSKLALEQAFDALRHGIDMCVNNFNRLVDGLGNLSWAFGPVPLLFIHNYMDDVRNAVTEAVGYGEKVLQSGVPVLSLFVTSIDYLNAAQAPVSDIAYDINTPQDDNIHAWSGAAAAAYKQKQAAQKAAADKTTENAVGISKWLFDVAKTNVAYATEIVKLLVDIGMELVSVTVNAALVINIQFALADLANAVKKALKAAVVQLVEIGNRFVATLGDARDLLARRNDHSAFEDGKWPRAVYN